MRCRRCKRTMKMTVNKVTVRSFYLLPILFIEKIWKCKTCNTKETVRIIVDYAYDKNGNRQKS